MTEIRFTQEARTAILKAVRYAVTSGCCRVEPPCLAKVLLNGKAVAFQESLVGESHYVDFYAGRLKGRADIEILF